MSDLQTAQHIEEKNQPSIRMNMALLEVINYGHPTLRKVAESYKKEEVDQVFVDNMLETMYVKDGVGLAAPQVNVSKRLIVCYDRENEYVLFNPKIVAHSERVKSDIEGCLSLPGLQADVPRYERVVVTAKDQDWNPVEIDARGLLAVILQHEIDHINGVLYIDHADLSTLKWSNADSVKESLRGQSITLDQVQSIFKDKYHSKTPHVVYDQT